MFDIHPFVTQICPGLFLGGEESALDIRLHHKLNFGLVVNCSNHIPFVRQKNPVTCYVKLAVEDNLRIKEVNKLAKLLPKTITQIHETLANGKNVLVHCRLGRCSCCSISDVPEWNDTRHRHADGQRAQARRISTIS